MNELITTEQVTAAFEASNKKVGDKIIFTPEIKVKRDAGMLYISELRKTKINYLAVVEVYKDGHSDKAPMSLNTLDGIGLKAIYIRLSA